MTGYTLIVATYDNRFHHNDTEGLAFTNARAIRWYNEPINDSAYSMFKSSKGAAYDR